MKYFKTILSILIAVAVIVGICIAISKKSNKLCNKISVDIQYAGENKPIAAEEIVELIKTRDLVLGKKIGEIDLKAVNQAIQEENLIRSIDHIAFRGERLNITLTLEQMLLHVFSPDGGHYFITTEGKILPYTTRIKERLIIVNGNLPCEGMAQVDSGALKSVYTLAQLISQDAELTAQYRQIHVNKKQQLELIPTVGKHTILLGDTTQMQNKFARIKEFNRQILTTTKGKEYSHLDVRFKNKIIAR